MRATAAKPVRKRKKPPAAEESVSDAAEESEDGDQQETGKNASSGPQGSKRAVKSVSHGEEM